MGTHSKSNLQFNNMKVLLSLLPSFRQNLRPMPTMAMEVMADMDMVDTEDTDMVDTEDTDMVDTVARDLLMPMPKPLQKLKLKPPQTPGTDMDTPDSHTLMVDTDTHMLMDMVVTDMVDTVERDPLSHTMVMEVTDTEDTD